MTTPLAIVVELYLNGAWVDISADVYGEGDIQIERGTSGWSDSVQAARCNLVLKNKAGKYSSHNPASPYYRWLGRNIPLRVKVEGYPRFVGEVSEWPQRIDPKLNVPVEASGVLRRLSRTITDEQSPIYRGFMRAVDPRRIPAAYWPCEVGEEDDDTLQPAETRKGEAMSVSPSEQGLGSRAGFAGSKPLITLNDSTVWVDIPTYGATSDGTMVAAMVRLPDDGLAADNTPIMTVNCAGTAAYWRIRANINGTLNLQIADPTTDGGGGGVITTSANSTWSIKGKNTLIGLGLIESGGTIAWTLLAWSEGDNTSQSITANLGSRTFRRVTRVVFGSNRNTGATAVGHLAVWRETDLANSNWYFLIHDLVNGHRGEKAAARAERIAQEEGIVFATVGDTSRSMPMTQQGAKSGVDLLTESVDADGGFLIEPPDFVSRTIADGENGTVGDLTGVVSTLAVSATQVHSGAQAVRVTWNSGAAYVQAVETHFIPNASYTFTAWVYIQATGPHVKLVVDAAESGPSTVRTTWQQLSVTFTATAYTHTVKIVPATAPTAGQQIYVDDVKVIANRAGLQLRPLQEVYNQAAALNLNYTAAEIAPPFEPADDDRWLLNDVAVTVEGQGSPSRYTLETGPLSTGAPPNGVGLYSSGVTRNVLTGYLGSCWARWLVHLGTWNEPRFPQLTVNLNRKRPLIPTATQVDPGTIIAGTNLPTWLMPRTLKQIVYGLSERINVRTWQITYNCAPGRPYDVFAIGDTQSRLATTSVLAAGTTAPAPGTTGTISVTSTGTRWATSGIFPVTITVAPVKGMVGEDMTVTAISGTGLTQTFTVTRGVNGVTAAWQSGDAVFLTRRPTLPL